MPIEEDDRVDLTRMHACMDGCDCPQAEPKRRALPLFAIDHGVIESHRCDLFER